MKNDFWQRGEMAALAKAAGISQQQLSEILHRKRGVSMGRALWLAECTHSLWGSDWYIEPSAWAFNKHTKHPAFFDVEG